MATKCGDIQIHIARKKNRDIMEHQYYEPRNPEEEPELCAIDEDNLYYSEVHNSGLQRGGPHATNTAE